VASTGGDGKHPMRSTCSRDRGGGGGGGERNGPSAAPHGIAGSAETLAAGSSAGAPTGGTRGAVRAVVYHTRAGLQRGPHGGPQGRTRKTPRHQTGHAGLREDLAPAGGRRHVVIGRVRRVRRPHGPRRRDQRDATTTRTVSRCGSRAGGVKGGYARRDPRPGLGRVCKIAFNHDLHATSFTAGIDNDAVDVTVTRGGLSLRT